MTNIQDILNKIGNSTIAQSFGPALHALQSRKLVYQYDRDGNLVQIHKSKAEVIKKGFTTVSNSIKKRELCKGYYFSYEKITDLESYTLGKKTQDSYIKSIHVYDLNGNYLYTQSRIEFQKENHLSDSLISTYFSRKHKTICGKFILKISTGSPLQKIEPSNRKLRNKKVGKYDLSGNLIEEYESLTIAGQKNGITKTSMTRWVQNNSVKNNCQFKLIP
jgi:hypothetical protein